MTVVDTLAAVAEHLGDGWSAAPGPDPDRGYLYGPNRLAIFAITPAGNAWADRGRIRFVATFDVPDLWERCRLHLGSGPTCTVAAGRDPAAIARTLARVVIEPWRPVLVETLDRAVVHADHVRRRDNLITVLGALFPGGWWSEQRELRDIGGRYAEDITGTFRLQTGATSEVRLVVPSHQVLALAEAIAALRAQGPRAV